MVLYFALYLLIEVDFQTITIDNSTTLLWEMRRANDSALMDSYTLVRQRYATTTREKHEGVVNETCGEFNDCIMRSIYCVDF